MSESNLGDTKEKILMDTNQLVISLNTQVAVLTNSNNTLKETVEGYMEKLDKKMDRLDERDATLDSRMTVLRNDHTELKGKVDNAVDDIRELKNKSNLFDLINLAVTAIVGTIMYFMFGRQP